MIIIFLATVLIDASAIYARGWADIIKVKYWELDRYYRNWLVDNEGKKKLLMIKCLKMYMLYTIL